MTFKETGLRPEILRAIEELGFETPTPIQQETIPFLINNEQDLVALAQTGTGKTAAFGLPLLHILDENTRSVQALVLSPTRELAVQIERDLYKYSKYLTKLNVGVVYGGASIQNQIRDLKKGCDIVVGTPGRVLDLIRRGALQLQDVRYLVLDEADEMLNMGFKDDLEDILSATPKERKTLLFSATMPKEIARIAQRYMRNAHEIAAGVRNSGADKVEHHYYVVQAKDRYEALKRVALLTQDIYGIVFCRTRKETREVARKLMEDGYNADALYGDLTQAQRDEVMARFRAKRIQLLVATDVAARGIDVDSLTHVINYELPDDLEAYIHRSGRTGRAGKEGISIAIVHGRELRKINHLEKLLKKRFERKHVPSGEEWLETRVTAIIDKLKNFEPEDKKLSGLVEKIQEGLPELETGKLLSYLVSNELGGLLRDHAQWRDLNLPDNGARSDSGRDRDGGRDRDRGRGREDRFDGGVEEGYVRFEMNVGREHHLNAARLMGMVNELTGRKDIQFGKIDIGGDRTWFEVEQSAGDKIVPAFEDIYFEDDNKVIVKPSTGGAPARGGNRGGNRDGRRSGGGGRGRGDRDRRDGGGSRGGGRYGDKRGGGGGGNRSGGGPRSDRRGSGGNFPKKGKGGSNKRSRD